MSTLVGMQLNGRYRLDAQIGAGGMSTVYRAFDQTLERRVAIKLMHREIASDSDQLERFRREARAVAQLSPPAHRRRDRRGRGRRPPLHRLRVRRGRDAQGPHPPLGRLPVDEALAYAIEIARALGAAHARGIVHRDIKPQNVLIDEEGTAKVTDFGIARSLDEEGLTADGRVLGTTDYVSPEQALGHDVNGQSDIYSLGIVLYEMLTGDVPFHGENQVAVAMKHVREDLPDVAARRPEVSARPRRRAGPHDVQGPRAPLPGRATRSRTTSRTCSAVEAARSGRATGEATAVLRTLPGQRAPAPAAALRCRAPAARVLVVGWRSPARSRACCSTRARDRMQRGTGRGRGQGRRRARARLRPRTLGHGLRPARRRRGAPRAALARRRRRPGHVVDDRELHAAGHAGRQGRRRALRRRRSPASTPPRCRSRRRSPAGRRSSTPRPTGRSRERSAAGRRRRRQRRSARQRFTLDTAGKRYRYYLIWITRCRPAADAVEIGERRC